jgi:hypothetical protein
MNLRRIALSAALAVLAVPVWAGAAQAAPAWNLDIHHNQTHFAPGGTGEYWLAVNNVGDADTSGPITLKLNLPNNIKRNSVRSIGNQDKAANFNKGAVAWSCPGSPGDAALTCTTSASIARHSLSRSLIVTVNVSGAPGTRFASAKVEGGGATNVATAVEPTQVDPVPAGFGILPHTFVPDFFQADGLTVEREAGVHPDLAVFPFDFNSVDAPTVDNPLKKLEAESVRNVVVDTPPGFVGAPTAVAECKQAEFTVGECPLASQVGRFDANLAGVLPTEGINVITVGVFNLAHPLGFVTDLAFAVAGNPVHIKVSLDPANRYAIRSTVPDINETLPPFDQSLTLWGVPGDKSHDSERCPIFVGAQGPFGGGNTSNACSTNSPPKPFLTLPSQCESDNVMRIHHYDSWQDTGDFGPEIPYTLPGKMTDCHKPRFEPKVDIEPTGKQANTPTGLDVHIQVAQNDNPNALATPPVQRISVTLPEGTSFSPSFADGLQSCTLAQMQLGNNEPVQCPDASRIGEVELSTPLLPKRAEGSMYLAAQRDNPFNSTFALLLVLEDTEERGALIKIPGRIDVDPVTGQIVTTFEDTPQFPFDDLTLKFRSGPRAPLVSPPSCGKQTIGVEVASYARPQDPVDASNTYQVTEGPGGTPCPGDVSSRPFAPKFSAGTLNPVAGAYSTFLFRLSRSDEEQELTGIKTVLPPGLVGRIAGMSFCPEAAIASIATAEGAGAGEAANPACPASSEFGSISAGLGAGPGPNYFPGKVYLAGPYKGAQLSLAVVAPGLAGPFDLGNVVVRAALNVNPETTQVTAISDAFPTILHGVILRTRDVRLRVDRPQTTINPTNCSKMSVNGEVGGIGGAIFNTQVPFQVGSCGDLTFKPRLALRLFGGTKRGAHPKFRATLTMPPGGANIGAASVALPKSEFLDQGHIKTICTRVQFAAEACPTGSIYGKVEAITPLLDETLTGNIYLRSSSNPLPDLVAAFRRGKIDANVVGRIDSVNGGIRNTFDFVPDVPVTKAVFTFAGGKKGLLVNSRNICSKTFRATARFTGQNGAQHNFKPKMVAKCGKARKGGKGKKRRR